MLPFDLGGDCISTGTWSIVTYKLGSSDNENIFNIVNPIPGRGILCTLTGGRCKITLNRKVKGKN